MFSYTKSQAIQPLSSWTSNGANHLFPLLVIHLQFTFYTKEETDTIRCLALINLSSPFFPPVSTQHILDLRFLQNPLSLPFNAMCSPTG